MMSKSQFTPAGIWLRTLAGLTETALFFLIYIYIANTVISSSHNFQDLITNVVTYLALVIFPLAIFNIFNYSLLTYLFGGPIGKLVTGLRVTDLEGNKLTFKKSLFRHWVAYYMSFVLLGLGFISIQRDFERRGWHDKAAGTRVIVAATLWPLSLLLLAVLIFANVYFGGQAVRNFKSNTLLWTDLGVFINQIIQEDLKSNTDESIDNLDTTNIAEDRITTKKETEFNTKYNDALQKFESQDYQGAYVGAQGLLTIAETDEQKGWSNYLLADSEYELYKSADAEGHIVTALKYLPDEADVNNVAGEIYVDEKKYKTAIPYARRAVKLDPNKAWYHANLALALYYDYQDTEALAEMQKAIDLDPTNDSYKKNLADMKAN